jgi:protein SCO1
MLGMLAVGLLAMSMAASAAHSGERSPDRDLEIAPTAKGFERSEAMAISQGAIGRAVGNHRFVDTDGTPLTLDQFAGKPLIVSLVFTSCAHICPATTQYLKKAVAQARSTFGNDRFNVVTIGFDARRDTPEAMATYARRQGVSGAGWHFLAADQATVDGLAAELGFLYFPSGGGFDHLIQSTIVGGDGVIYRQVYGIDFELPHLFEPLKELIYALAPDQSFYASLSNRVRLFCTVYDPASDSYRFSYAIFVGLAMGLLLGLVAIQMLVREWAKYRRSALRAQTGVDA